MLCTISMGDLMVKINKKVEYALMALKHMSLKSEGELTTAREICDKYNVPFDTTSKVMQQMNNFGMFKSHKGVKGGYSLAINLKNISYLELTELVEGKKSTVDCELTKCNLLNSCNIVSPMKKLNDHLMYFFSGLSLDELLVQNAHGPLDKINEVTGR
jgi:Rrf2 family nitric oxide-sensitive transcriptional repressor